MNKHARHYQEIRDGFVLRRKDSEFDTSSDEEDTIEEEESFEDDDTDSSAGSTLNTVILPLLNRR
jgi:hypothetical protein